MKKILLALMILSFTAAFASAQNTNGVKIAWQTAYGVYDHASSDVTGNTHAILDSYSVTWQLIYCGVDNQIDVPDTFLGGAGIADDYVTDDDVVWATRTIGLGGGTASQDGTGWDQWLINQSGSTTYKDYTWGNTAGSVYQRIFEGTPTQLSWYFDSAPLPFATSFNTSNEHISPDFLISGTGSAGIQPNKQIGAPVPEPATMSLLGLGALVMAIRRRRS